MERDGVRKNIIIAGAGLAGLSAGYELGAAGYNVTILEARTRPGGRVYTLREPFSDGLYAEAGAVFIASCHNHTMHYVKLFELPLVSVPPRMLAAFAYIRGRRILFEDQNPDWSGLNLTPEEKALGYYGMMEKYVGGPAKEIGDPTTPGWPPESLKRFDDLSFTGLLREQGASPDAIALLRLGYFDIAGDGADHNSALHLLRDHALNHAALEWWAIKGGNDSLPKAFASRLQDRIYYGAPITRIEHDQKGVRVIYMHDGQARTMSGDHLVCTIPFSVLRHIEIAPKFSPDKQKSVAELSYASVVRVYLQSRKRFWADDPINGAGGTDLPIMLTMDPTYAQPGMRGILEAYMAGDQARKMTPLSVNERVGFVLGHMEKIFPGIRENFEGGASKSWDDDPYTKGDYAWFKPGQMRELLPVIGAPEGRVHFAGEHASPWPGWMQGAFHAAHRVVEEIKNA